MNRTLAALLVPLAVITGCSIGPVGTSPAAAWPSLDSAEGSVFTHSAGQLSRAAPPPPECRHGNADQGGLAHAGRGRDLELETNSGRGMARVVTFRHGK